MQRLWAVLRVSIALWIGTVLLVCNFGYGWQKDSVYVQTQYKAFTDEEIDAEVGLHVGLRGVNITLKGGEFDLVFKCTSKTKNACTCMQSLKKAPIGQANSDCQVSLAL